MKIIRKITIILFTIAALMAFAPGCKPKADSTADATAKQMEKVEKTTKAMAKDIKDYTYAQRAEYVADMKAQLAKLNTSIDELSARIEKSSAAVKAESKPKLQALRDQYAKLGRQLDEIKNADESTWESVKTSVGNSFNALTDGFNQMRQWVSEKVAP